MRRIAFLLSPLILLTACSFFRTLRMEECPGLDCPEVRCRGSLNFDTNSLTFDIVRGETSKPQTFKVTIDKFAPDSCCKFPFLIDHEGCGGAPEGFDVTKPATIESGSGAVVSVSFRGDISIAKDYCFGAKSGVRWLTCAKPACSGCTCSSACTAFPKPAIRLIGNVWDPTELSLPPSVQLFFDPGAGVRGSLILRPIINLTTSGTGAMETIHIETVTASNATVRNQDALAGSDLAPTATKAIELEIRGNRVLDAWVFRPVVVSVTGRRVLTGKTVSATSTINMVEGPGITPTLP